MKFKIKWKSNHTDIYKYGSSIEFTETKTYFKNELLPPGTAIIRWNSNSEYLSDRTILQLPLLEKQTRYELSLDAQMVPEDSVLIKLDFFDRLGDKIETEIFARKSGKFTYPKNAYSYTISIVGIGVQKLIFSRLILCKDN